MPKIYQNLSGTMKSAFKIGKHGPQIIRGYGNPNDHDFEEIPLLGSLYLDQLSGDIYHLTIRGWELLNKDYSTYNYFTMLAMQETIREVYAIANPPKPEGMNPETKLAIALFVLGFIAFLAVGITLILFLVPE